MRAALYARVSTEEQTEGYSIEAQRRAFQTLCQSKDWIPQHEYIEGGKSAHTEDMRKRPIFKQAMDDAIAGQYDVLVVHKIDRFSRKLRVTIEYFEKLGKAGVGFVSIENDMDYSTPTGKFMLVMQGGLAELYSDNLSQETKKGWHERRKQGLYCGALPFGAMKGEDKVPIPDTQEREIEMDGQRTLVRNYDGLKFAFEMAGQGKSDREIAIALNTRGYRTTGTHGSRTFSKDTIKGILSNPFYVGYISDGNGGFLRAQHEPLVRPEIFEETQKMRQRRASKSRGRRSDATIYSLSGLTRCAQCGNTMRTFKARGRPRLVCNGRIKDGSCKQPSGFLDIYEQQLLSYLEAFQIPANYKEQIIEGHKKLESAYSSGDIGKRRAILERRKHRLTELYSWGHKKKEEYIAEYSDIERELHQLASGIPNPSRLSE